MIINCKVCKSNLPVPNAAFKYGMPKISCPKCGNSFKPQLKEEEETVLLQHNYAASTAWLIVHDEQAPIQTFEIKKGKYIVGRKSHSKPCDIMIETQDKTMSRNHFIIEALAAEGFMKYSVEDCQSANHVFINTTALKEKVAQVNKGEKYYVKDGDIIQAGLTKIVFKLKTGNISNAEAATELVKKKEYAKTVII